METWWGDGTSSGDCVNDEVEKSGENFAIVVFNTDGGITDDGTMPLPIRVLWGNNIPRIRAIGKGIEFGFAGWMDESGTLWDFETRTVKPEDDVNEDGFITLTAKWSLVTFTVSFTENYEAFFAEPKNQNGDIIKIKDQIIAIGCKVSEPPVIPTGTGHGLVGWYTENGTHNDHDTGETGGWGRKWDFTNDEVSADITLYARWSLYTRTVHLQVNGGTRPGPSIPPMEITRVNFTIFTGLDGNSGGVIIDPGPIARDGYTFGGWYTSLAFTDEWFFTRKLYEVDETDHGIMLKDPFTLYAKWVPNIYTVTLNANEGSPTLSSQAVTHGERVIKPNISGSPGRVIEGWYTINGLNNDDDWGTKWNFDTNVVTKTMTLFAKWEDATYEIRFHLGSPPTDTYTLPFPMLAVPDVQYVRPSDKVTEPFMPQRTPPPLPAEATSWSFYRWEYHTTQHSAPVDVNASGFRSGLAPWDFDWIISAHEDKLDFFATDTDASAVLNIYASWVPPVPGMIWVPRGSFIMGESGVSGSPAILHAYPTRVVTLDGFYISRSLVTQKEYKDLMETDPLSLLDKDGVTMRTIMVDPSNTKGNTNPVERVSWYDAIRYCNLLSDQDGLSEVYEAEYINAALIPPTAPVTNYNSISLAAINNVTWTASGYRLPTEAEWEYAAKGGSGMGPYLTYSGSNDASLVAWFNTNSSGRTHPVNMMTPNNLGIYDMSGNVSEWCWDALEAYKNLTANTLNPRVGNIPISAGVQRIRRGGAWSNTMANVRTVVRNSDTPDTAHWAIGFRVVRGPAGEW